MVSVSARGAMFRPSIETKEHKSNTPIQVLVLLCFIRLPENGTLVPKHLGIILTMSYISLHFIGCIWWLISSIMFSFLFDVRHIKMKMQRNTIFHVLLCEYETWAVTLKEGHRLIVCVCRVLKKVLVFGTRREEVIEGWRTIDHNKTLLFNPC